MHSQATADGTRPPLYATGAAASARIRTRRHRDGGNRGVATWFRFARLTCSVAIWLFRLVRGYRAMLSELESLSEHDLRDLRFDSADFHAIERTEAQRRYRVQTHAMELSQGGGLRRQRVLTP